MKIWMMIGVAAIANFSLAGCGNVTSENATSDSVTSESVSDHTTDTKETHSVSQVPVPILPADLAPVADEHPYDEMADANAALDAALSQAKTNGKTVLVKLGGNWCPDCRIMAGVLDLQQVSPWLHENFEYVKVDIGRYDHNMDIPARYGIEKLKGVPTVLLIKPDGTLLNAATSADFTNARDRNPQEIIDYLAKWRDVAVQ